MPPSISLFIRRIKHDNHVSEETGGEGCRPAARPASGPIADRVGGPASGPSSGNEGDTRPSSLGVSSDPGVGSVLPLITYPFHFSAPYGSPGPFPGIRALEFYF